MNQGPICAKVYPEGIQPIKGNNCGLIPPPVFSLLAVPVQHICIGSSCICVGSSCLLFVSFVVLYVALSILDILFVMLKATP